MRILQIISTQVGRPTELSVAEGRDRSDRFWPRPHLMQQLNLKVPINPRCSQSLIIHTWKQMRPGPSRFTYVQAPQCPNRHTRRHCQSWPTVWYEFCFNRTDGITTHWATQQEKKWPSTEINTLKNSHFLQISGLWGFLKWHISGALAHWYLHGLHLYSYHLSKSQVACIALKI